MPGPGRYLHDVLLDAANFLTRRDRDLPPVRYRRVGKGDFREMGEWVARFLIEHGLRADDDVLDIGCGIGRVAIQLTKILSSSASYRGFDANAQAIRWCQR